MATYGLSFYGTEKYGRTSRVDFDAGTVAAEPTGYDRVALTWTSPGGSWDKIRVLRNWTGFSFDENDGEVIAESKGALSSTVDSTVRPGAWHYYTIWVHSGSDWYVAGSAAALMSVDHEYAERLFESLPLYHRYTQGVLDDLPAVENETLKTFLSVLAVGMNYLKTYYDALRVLNDPMRNHLAQMIHLGEQFGIEYAPVTPSHLHRAHVRNAGTLAREKGTLEHLRSLISLTVGWDAEITPGNNLMLNEDRASFVNPTFPAWDVAMNYAAGEMVTYGGFLYKAKTGGAYGEAQKPSGTTSGNTWWDWIQNLLYTDDSKYLSKDGTVRGWVSKSFTGGVTPGALAAGVGLGVQSATDPTVSAKNCLYLRNNASPAVTADFGVSSVDVASGDPINAIRNGVPIPKADRDWVSTRLYEVGEIVLYKGKPYRAKTRHQNSAPSTSGSTTQWEILGKDDRIRITGSLYVKGGSTTHMQSRLAYPVMEFFDDKGALITTVDTSQAHSLNHLDSFTSATLADLAGRTLDSGGQTWSAAPTGWKAHPDGYAYPTASGSYAYITGAADGRVSATFHREATGSAKQGVILRHSGTDLATGIYLKATRTALYSVNAGTATLVGTYSKAFADGDRITVSFVGSAIKVYRNGTQVLSVTSTVNQTATRHGMLVV